MAKGQLRRELARVYAKQTRASVRFTSLLLMYSVIHVQIYPGKKYDKNRTALR